MEISFLRAAFAEEKDSGLPAAAFDRGQAAGCSAPPICS
jgi:hypothetical protein